MKGTLLQSECLLSLTLVHAPPGPALYTPPKKKDRDNISGTVLSSILGAHCPRLASGVTQPNPTLVAALLVVAMVLAGVTVLTAAASPVYLREFQRRAGNWHLVWLHAACQTGQVADRPSCVHEIMFAWSLDQGTLAPCFPLPAPSH